VDLYVFSQSLSNGLNTKFSYWSFTIGVVEGIGMIFFTATPLFQTNFLPDLMQVNVLFPTTDLVPTLVHLAPALVAECAGIGWKVRLKLKVKTNKVRTLRYLIK
jgi:hypothetical protein